MARIRPMRPDDLLRIGTCNFDLLTETYTVDFYLNYLTEWPDLCQVIEGPDGSIEGYILAKTEESPYDTPVKPYSPDTNPNPNYLPWHGHISALTVSPHCRHNGHAGRLTDQIEDRCDQANAWFVDLFVRTINFPAIEVYKKRGYKTYRQVVGYYGDDDALDMRKSLSRDKGNKHTANKKPLQVPANVVW